MGGLWGSAGEWARQDSHIDPFDISFFSSRHFGGRLTFGNAFEREKLTARTSSGLRSQDVREKGPKKIPWASAGVRYGAVDDEMVTVGCGLSRKSDVVIGCRLMRLIRAGRETTEK